MTTNFKKIHQDLSNQANIRILVCQKCITFIGLYEKDISEAMCYLCNTIMPTREVWSDDRTLYRLVEEKKEWEAVRKKYPSKRLRDFKHLVD